MSSNLIYRITKPRTIYGCELPARSLAKQACALGLGKNRMIKKRDICCPYFLRFRSCTSKLLLSIRRRLRL